MRVRLLLITCFIVVLSCTQAISSLCLHGNFSSKHTSLNSSNSNMQTKQPITTGNHGSIKEEKYNELSYEYGSIKKAQRGKGANGGANVNYHHPHRSVNSAPSLLPWFSTLCVSLILILIFSFPC